MNLKEANRLEELKDGLLYIKLQKKLPASMLTQYHRWIFENHKIESVEVLREWVIQESEFQIKALETVQGLTGRADSRSNIRGVSHTFLESQPQVVGSIHRLEIGPANCVGSSMECGLAVSLRSLKFQKGGIVLKG